MNWLFKEEPTHYSYDDLARDSQRRGPASETPSHRNTFGR